MAEIFKFSVAGFFNNGQTLVVIIIPYVCRACSRKCGALARIRSTCSRVGKALRWGIELGPVLINVLRLDSLSKVEGCIKFVGSRWPKEILGWLGVGVKSVGGLVGWVITRNY